MYIILIVILFLLGGVIAVLKKGFSEVVNGLESIDGRLKTIEEKLDKK